MRHPEVKFLYKYQALPTTGAEREKKLEAIKNNSAYFASPEEFNDPLDCRIEFRPDEKDRLKFLEFLIEHKLPLPAGCSLTEYLNQTRNGNKEARAALEEIFIKSPQSMLQIINLAIYNTMGIFCLAESPLCSLMWSHYSDSHKGYCVEYERSPGSLLASNTQTFRVRYTNEYPCITIDDFLESMNAVKKALEDGKFIPLEDIIIGSICLTKADCWGYEKEWRVVAPNKGFIKDSKLNRKKIIFGMRTSEADIKAIRDVLPPAIECEKVCFKERSFELTRAPLP
jgi:hypothetical protein